MRKIVVLDYCGCRVIVREISQEANPDDFITEELGLQSSCVDYMLCDNDVKLDVSL